MKSFFWVTLFAFILSLYFLPAKVKANTQFAVDSKVTYRVDLSGKTEVEHEITLENLTSGLYATSYTLTLENINADSIKAFDQSGREIPQQIKLDGLKVDAKFTFSDSVVGINARRHFKIYYQNSNFAVKTGEVWEISIPKLADDDAFRNYTVNLEIPDTFGQEAYISPKPTQKENAGGIKRYTFSKQIIHETGVTAGFGQFQVFSFNLSYHLENPLAVNSQTEIALPPDTALQKVYFSKVTPKPASVKIDGDGNYIAIYKLSPRQRIDVNTEGFVQIFAGHRPFPVQSEEDIKSNLKPTKYWQVDDPEIKLLAQTLKTPQEIYKFVSTKLQYNFDRVQPNVTRMGALSALKNPTQAICMEFTDLFIAISRAAGIPAREINGFAYTENRDLQPLSLVADVLHAWPEYYDAEKKVWVPVDPTWGSTSGIDYFNKLDLRHFTFVIHGASDKEPYPPGSYKLGPNPQKDVFVSFGQLPAEHNSIPKISIKTDRNIPFLDTLYTISVYNPGPASLYNFYPTIYFDEKLKGRTEVHLLPPFASYSTQIRVPYSLLGKSTPDNIKVVVNESEISLPTNKTQVVINTLIILFTTIIIVVILILEKLGIIDIIGIADKISHLYSNAIKRFKKNPNNP